LVPGSRVNHLDSRPALIEVQVYHFSGVQAVVGGSGTTEEEEKPPKHDGSGAVVYASCFINSAAGGADFGFAAVFGVITAGLLIRFRQKGFLLRASRCRVSGKKRTEC
jgi:hypothetical protein